MTAIDELVARHNSGSNRDTPTGSAPIPSMHVAVVTCMDARINVFDVFGLRHGEAHVLRNGGGVITDDMIRSLSLSQRKLETREVIVMQHTSCGLSSVTEDSFKDEIEADIGIRPPWAVESFRDVEASVRQSVERVRRSPFIPYPDKVRGFVYDVQDATVREIQSAK